MRDLNDSRQKLALRFSHVELPAYATDCEPWEWFDGAWRRSFTVRDWNVAGLRVSVGGEQTHDGDVTRWMRLGGEDNCTGSDGRLLIAALVDAGELLDSLDTVERLRRAQESRGLL